MLQFLIPAAASLGASLLSKSSSDKANSVNAANHAAQVQLAREQNEAAERNALRQEQLQREFATSGIQWKVEDAKKAGVHPLYALGAQTTAYAPQTVGYTMPPSAPSHTSPDWRGISDAGQHIGRAIQSTQNATNQQAAAVQAFQATQIEGLQLDNEIKRAELASRLATTRAGTNPGIPSAGPPSPFDLFGGVSGDAIKLSDPAIKTETRRDVADRDMPAYIPGSGPSVGWTTNTTGGYTPVIPPELAESYESDKLGMIDWMIRNRLLPNLTGGTAPKIPHDPDREEIQWSRLRQQYEVVPKFETVRRLHHMSGGFKYYRR